MSGKRGATGESGDSSPPAVIDSAALPTVEDDAFIPPQTKTVHLDGLPDAGLFDID